MFPESTSLTVKYSIHSPTSHVDGGWCTDMPESADERKGQEFLSLEFLTLHHLPQRRQWALRFPLGVQWGDTAARRGFLPPIPLNICIALTCRVFPQTQNTTCTDTNEIHGLSKTEMGVIHLDCQRWWSPGCLHGCRAGGDGKGRVGKHLCEFPGLGSTLQQNEDDKKGP